jgi:hypothetical protein
MKTICLEKTNSMNINIEIIKLLGELFSTADNYKNLGPLVSDVAPYTIKVGKI